MVKKMRLKIAHAKTSTNAILSLKVGQTVLTLNHVQNSTKLLQSSPAINANLAINSRFDEQRIRQIEAEQRRNQGRTYASVMPIR